MNQWMEYEPGGYVAISTDWLWWLVVVAVVVAVTLAVPALRRALWR